MANRFRLALSMTVTLIAAASAFTQNLPWNNPGRAQNRNQQQAAAGPAPRRDITGIWDAGGEGISGKGFTTPPLTPWGEEMGKTHKAGDGTRMVPIPEINDPLSTLGDPAGFPRLLLFELRPVQIVQLPNSVLMLYMFEKR